MTRSLVKVMLLTFAVSAGWVGLYFYQRHNSRDAQLEQTQQQLQAERQKTEQLRQVVQYLGSETRVADVVVFKQWTEGGQPKSQILFQEYGKDGSTLPPRWFVINGNEAHIDGQVIKFQGKYVEEKDPLRGRSVTLFTKLFDDTTPPDKAYPIDVPGHIPAVYQGADPQVRAFEEQLWQDFWKLAADKSYRDRMGVDVVQGKGIWWRFEPGYLYTINLQNDADWNLRYEPLKGIYKEMLKKQQANPL